MALRRMRGRCCKCQWCAHSKIAQGEHSYFFASQLWSSLEMAIGKPLVHGRQDHTVAQTQHSMYRGGYCILHGAHMAHWFSASAKRYLLV